MYSSFALEAIVATAFGRQVNIQRGESDDFSKAMDTTMKGLSGGQFENFILLHSKLQACHNNNDYHENSGKLLGEDIS